MLMTFDVYIVHLILAIALFLIVNWIGKHSYTAGYIEISIFTKNEEAPASNFAIRVLTPVVFIIVTSYLFYNFKMDKYVTKIYWVPIYSILLRLLYNLF